MTATDPVAGGRHDGPSATSPCEDGRHLRVAFVDRLPRSGFLATDLACLESSFEVRTICYPGRNTARYLWDCFSAALRCHALYVFFASEHALVPVTTFKLLRRRVVLVQGGYDYANVPERRYGLAARGHGWLPKLVGRLADVSLAISDQSRWEFLALVPSAAPRARLAYLAVDPGDWLPAPVDRHPDRVVTFGYVDAEAYSRKGIDRFVQAAIADPGREYVLAGRVAPDVADRIGGIAPPNLRLPGHLDHEQLRSLLWSAGVYAQLSWHETFGVAMAEAILCGCVPVISDSPALVEVAGQWAVRVGTGEADVDAIGRAAARAQYHDVPAARADLGRRFSVQNRADALRQAVVGSWG